MAYKRFFEQLVLEGAQAGLSWITILRRRHHHKRVFCEYNVVKLAQFTDQDIATAWLDKGIIRNRLKVNSVVNNAAKFIAVQQEFGSFDAYMQFIGMVNDHIKSCFCYFKCC